MERIGIFGGTFNPPHIGHRAAARAAVEALGLTRLLVIPDRIAPHKHMPENSPTPEERLRLVEACMAGIAQVQVSDLELRRAGVSYTVDTVEQLARENPDAQLVLLMGSDMFCSFLDWRKPMHILRHAELGVLFRGDSAERAHVAQQKKKLEEHGAVVHVIENPVVDISSTDLRRMLVFGCASPFLVPEVAAQIQANGFYGAGGNYRKLPMDALERVVTSLLDPGRVNHVLGCRDTAAELARKYGADETDAARAGLLHDITKALSGPLQLTLCREYGIVLDGFSQQNPKTLHALTGSLVAERIFGENAAVVAAICSHTTGKPAMTLLEKILYLADYVEPNRDFPGVKRLRALTYHDIDAALEKGLEMTLEVLRTQNREISPASEQALDYLRAHGSGGKKG